jgi:hypothetical protein
MGSIEINDFQGAKHRRILTSAMPHRLCVLLFYLAGVVAFVWPADAHHGSNISYHTDQTITLTGTVVEWEFINPHPQIYFDVKNSQGETEHWATELLPTPSMMKNMKVGWSRTTIKPGDTMTLICNPPRAEGAKACLAKELMVNGKAWPLAAGPGAGKAGPGAPAGKGKE